MQLQSFKTLLNTW